MNRRGSVMVPQSVPTVLNSRDTVPLRASRSTFTWSRSVLPPVTSVARKKPRIRPTPTISRVEYRSVTVNVPLAGGTEGALRTSSDSWYVIVLEVAEMVVAVLVVDVADVNVAVVIVVSVALVTVVVVNDVLVAVVVVLVAISMLNVALAKRAGTDESPTGKAYMYMRGDVTLHKSLKPSVESCTSTVPLCAGKITFELPPICTVEPSARDVVRRNARSCAVPAASTVEYCTVTTTGASTGMTAGPAMTSSELPSCAAI